LEVFIARDLYGLSRADWQHLTATFTFGSGETKAELDEIIRGIVARVSQPLTRTCPLDHPEASSWFQSMSTVAEIKKAIDQLSAADRSQLMAC
jgi:hypothetical protein